MNTLSKAISILSISLIISMGGGVEIIAQTRCYTTNYNKAEQLYRQGRYAEARRHYAAASACPDKPKQNNIAARISACDAAINEIRQRERAEQQRQEAERERIRKERERQEQERREREEAERRRQQEQRQREIRYGKDFTVNGVSFTMILVEGGTFTMGDNSVDYTVYDDVDITKVYGFPATEHQVTLSDYYIGQTEVTQALWEAVMGDLPWMMDERRGDNKPMDATWDEWQTFINRLNELTGLKFRMPTEAEWEYAAMGGNRSRGYIYAGSNDLNEVAWYEENSGGHYQPVATKKPNELNLYDMSGNAYEFVSDWFAHYSSAPQTNPTGPRRGKAHMTRGCGAIHSIIKFETFFRIKTRYIENPIYNFDYGLRLALSAK